MKNKATAYSINLDAAFQPMERFDVTALAGNVQDPWFNQTLSRVNDCVMRLGVVQGAFHWHHHDEEDELFYVIEGELLVDFDRAGQSEEPGRTVRLAPGQGIVVPKGVEHRTRAPERTIMLMFEGAGVQPTGD
jgi:mannose-6-phosphate isomerase-like protein (cupin superfamily)